MKTEIVINNVGCSFPEAVEAIENAEIELGVMKGSLVHLVYYPKAFVQRRKIGGNEALLYLVVCEGQGLVPVTVKNNEFTLTLGKVVQIGMLIFTGDNSYLKEQQLLLSSKAYPTADRATYAWNHQMKVLREEMETLAHPVAPTVTKQNYDVIEAVPAKVVLTHVEKALEVLRQARNNALSFAPNEGLEQIAEKVDDLFKVLYVAKRKAQNQIEEQVQIINRM